MNIPFVDLKEQYNGLKNEIDLAIQSVINDLAFIGGVNNKYVAKFEQSFADYLGVKNCISCANGTDSLEILLKAFGVGPGDEVIVPALTWISTSEAVSSVGATPIFVDVHPDYYTINANLIERKITNKTKAIIPVHLYGLPAEMDEIMSIAQKYNLIVIEDCAQAHGAEYKGQKVGTIGNAGSFSFYPGKNLGAYGDAGGMVMNDEMIANKARMIANHGQLKKHQHQIEGRNSRMDGLQAAILSVKLPYLDVWNSARIKNAKLYCEKLANSKIKLPKVPSYSKHVFHLFVIQTEAREAVMSALTNNRVENAIHYPQALPFLGAYSKFGYQQEDFPVSYKMTKRILSLPMFAELSVEDIDNVVSIINRLL